MRTTLLVIAALLALAMLPSSASAAVCADYATQADAQAAADTRDGDGDGRYCENLPCPCATGTTTASPPPAPSPSPPKTQPRTRCGVERWSVKTLTDQRASGVDLNDKTATVDELRALPAPRVGRNSPRFPGEFSTYKIKVRLRSMKIEDDGDVHLVVADTAHVSHTMIVEFPSAGCVRSASLSARRRMARARAGLLHACGAAGSSKFRLLAGTATISGVAFFDVIHGQRGVAPNGIELHPALSFRSTTRCR